MQHVKAMEVGRIAGSEWKSELIRAGASRRETAWSRLPKARKILYAFATATLVSFALCTLAWTLISLIEFGDIAGLFG